MEDTAKQTTQVQEPQQDLPNLPHLSTEPTMLDGLMHLVQTGSLSDQPETGADREPAKPESMDMGARLTQVEQSLEAALSTIRGLREDIATSQPDVETASSPDGEQGDLSDNPKPEEPDMSTPILTQNAEDTNQVRVEQSENKVGALPETKTETTPVSVTELNAEGNVSTDLPAQLEPVTLSEPSVSPQAVEAETPPTLPPAPAISPEITLPDMAASPIEVGQSTVPVAEPNIQPQQESTFQANPSPAEEASPAPVISAEAVEPIQGHQQRRPGDGLWNSFSGFFRGQKTND